MANSKIYYSDIDLTLKRNPITRDVMRKTNVASVNQSIRNIILTNRFEKRMNPDFGGNIYDTLFEFRDEFTRRDLQTGIKLAIENYEPRVQIVDVGVEYPEEKFNTVVVNIVFNYILLATDQEVNTKFSLERVR